MISNKKEVDNLIAKGDFFLLVLALLAIGFIATYFGIYFCLYGRQSYYFVIYLLIVAYILGALVHLGLSLRNYTKPQGNLKLSMQEAITLPFKIGKRC